MPPFDRKKRINVVLSIIVMIMIGILINLFSQFFYDLIITRSKPLGEELGYLYLLSVITIILSSVLSFLVLDFRSSKKRDKSLLYRLFDYYEEKDPVNRKKLNLNNIVISAVWLIIKWAATVYFFVVLVEKVNMETGIAWVILIITWLIMKSLFRKVKVYEELEEMEG